MQRFVNDPNNIVDDMLKGFVKAHKDQVFVSEKNDHVVVKRNLKNGKVGIVSGGGSGHEPCFLGYVGEHMLDAVAIGEVFSSPPATAFYEACKEVDKGAGVACLFGNYAGDNMNVKMAIQMAKLDGFEVQYVTACDDVASAPLADKASRHGIAGSLFMWKLACAKAELGGTLDEIIDVANRTVQETRSICVGLKACAIPAVGHCNFTIEEGTMEYGIGHHGEPGIQVEPLKTANEIADQLCAFIEADLSLREHEEVAVIISGLGSTPLMELYVLYQEVEGYLSKKGIVVYRSNVGNYVTSLEMNGVALTILRVRDWMKPLLDMNVNTPGYKQL